MSPDVPPQDVPPDVVKWLTEIQSLQRQVAELKQERDLAYTSADNLRSLYDTEAQQRQRDTLTAQSTINRLQKTLEALQSPQFQSPQTGPSELNSSGMSSIQSSIYNNRSVEQLQTQLIAAKQQCEQLQAMLTAEQADHAKTRENLTAALGDAVDLLAKERPGQRTS
jgi:uncharacterized protein with von Willebrand factor type A (vWA) domain